ncbi:1-acylglycerol-3-phosphate O-acyltransferase [Boothiomyces sp. JEL0838]|nr:1-acylglycerol-3-phosphate O-acyltransferase [Boothiomyces sp. JEL0838]
MIEIIYFIILQSLFYTLFDRSPTFRFYIRTILLFTAMAFGSLMGLLAAPLTLINKSIDVNATATYFNGLVSKSFAGVQVDVVSGKQHLRFTRPVVYVSNHQSNLDTAVLAQVYPERTVVIAKKELKSVPILGQVLQAGNNIFLDRKVRQSAIESMNKVGNRMEKDSLSLMIYPEGTRTHQITNIISTFKKGAFHLATQHGFDIVPIVNATYYPAYDENEKRFDKLIVQVKVLDPIPSAGKSVEELLKETHDKMSAALAEIQTIKAPCRKYETLL